MFKSERLSQADVKECETWQVLDKVREELEASTPDLLPGSLVIQARTQDGLLVRAGEDQAEIFRHNTPYGDLVLDRKRDLVQSPLKPGVNIRLPPSLGPILTRLLEDPGGLVSRAELYRVKYGEATTCSPSAYNNIEVSISRLRRLLGEKIPGDDRQLVFAFQKGEQRCYSLNPCLPNILPVEQRIDTARYEYRYQTPFGGELVLCADRGIVQSPLMPGQDIKLTPFETRLLATLMSDPKRVFPDQFLIQKVWQDRTPGSFSDPRDDLRWRMGQLRAKLGDTRLCRLIHNYRGFGYSLTGLKDPGGGAQL